MNPPKSYKKLSFESKALLIERIIDGESVTKIAREAGISRTIIYKWLSDSASAERNSSLSKKISRKKHWRKLPRTKEREVIRLWLDNPHFTIRAIAKTASVSVGGAFKIIKNYQVQAQKSGKKTKRYIRRKYKIFSSRQKIDLIKRYYQGEGIAKISRDTGISRTIFYRWLKSYGNIDDNSVLERNHARGQKHWRFKTSVRDMVLDIVVVNPQLSLSKIAIAVRNRGEIISKSGLYYILKNMNLSTYEARTAYISSYQAEEIDREKLVISKYSIPINAARILPQFAVFTLFWLVTAILLLSSIKQAPVINYPFTISNNPPETESRKDNYSKNVVEPQGRGGPPSLKLRRAKQDFGWGAMAINNSKDQFRTDEKVQLGFGVVDHLGNTICNAEIGLEIMDPKGEKMFGRGDSGLGAKQSGACSLQSITNTPDYEASIPALEREGLYSVNIEAKTYEGKREFQQNLRVSNNQPIEIERDSYPTRIYPLAAYPVSITIAINRDFRGTISENLPEGIKASNISGGGILFRKAGGQEHEVKWKVDLKKGQTYRLGYNLHFPQIWPEFYEIGPLNFTDSKTGKLVWQEARYWQIVADAL